MYILKIFKYVVIFCLMFLFNFYGYSQEIKLLNNGISSYKIVIPSGSTGAVKSASNIFKNYFYKISNVSLSIEESSIIKNDDKAIYIGFDVDGNNLKDDAILISTKNGNSLQISAQSARSVIYSVYYFLEKYLQCSFWTADEESIPKLKNISIPDLNFIYTPPFKYRSNYNYFSIRDNQYSAAIKQNGYGHQMGTSWGRPNEIEGFAHTFQKLIPVEKYFKKNPEWFTDPNNEHKPCTNKSKMPSNSETQLCLENKGLYQELLKNLLQWISNVKKSKPYSNTFSVSINDNNGVCNCEECIKKMQVYGQPSGLLILFLNKLIKDVRIKYPEVKLNTLAYLKYLAPPKNIKAEEGISVMIAPIRANFGYAINSDQNKLTRDYIKGWSKICDELYFWGYNTNFNNFLMPHPSFYHLGEDLIYLKNIGFVGAFIQDNIYTKGIGFFKAMDNWVTSKLLWDPSLNQESLVNQFFNGYYGDSGIYLKQYYDLIIKSYLESGVFLNTFNDDYSFLNSDIIVKGEQLFEKAIQISKNNDVILKRIEIEKLAFDYSKLYLLNNSKLKNFNTNSNNSEDFNKIINKIESYNIQKIALNKDWQTSKRQMIEKNELRVPMTKVNNKLIFQDSKFKLYQLNKSVFKISDNQASDQKSVSITSKKGAWVIQLDLKNYLSENLHNATINVFIKVDYTNSKIISNKSFLEFGSYNSISKTYSGKIRKDISLIKNGGYVSIPLKIKELTKSDIIYLSVLDIENRVNKILIDKIEIEE